ncbi:dTDP-4-dehydrorhamnose reductase [Olivibacter sitiensis]|uniref:dTDP-4-dehydrorhamnose reductase n=1 Tax=Olivibacter sitiensis TaxID=376470 RepID=UPI0003F4B10D|nr:dTDP-4-dehydrorhamnose reductase [Olivibacter sitiensis]
MKTVVFGGSGQLGQCLAEQVQGNPNYVFLSSDEGNVTKADQLRHLFEKLKPDVVVNCAAYTAVDKAEDEIDLAYAINSHAVKNLAILSKEYNSKLIHISTDFVFEGNKVGLLAEDDECKPQGVYGASKLEGEENIRAIHSKYFIVRTSWLYSEYGGNFVKTMLRLADSRNELSVVSDQVGTPTYAMDLAAFILNLISSKSETYGLYHYSDMGVASWYDFAHSIFDLGEKKINLSAIKTSQYPTRARRPFNSVMDKSKVIATFGEHIPHWRDSLRICLKNLVKK